jgi:hypothetical protein
MQLSLDFDKTPRQATLEELVGALSKQAKCRKAEGILRERLTREILRREVHAQRSSVPH